jgi:hypothetical protein
MRKLLAPILGAALLLGCTSAKVAEGPGIHTDDVVGQTYILQEPVFLEDGALFRLGFNGTPTSLDAFRRSNPTLQIFQEGQRLKITRVQVVKSPKTGAFIEVYAAIGRHHEVNIRWISQVAGKAVLTGVDPRFLKLQ